MNKILVSTDRIKKNYYSKDKKLRVLDDVSIDIKTGDLVALVGPSGSGKSSLLHILGLIEKPTSGKIKLFGEDLNKLSYKEKDIIKQKKISIIFQNNNLLEDFTALENILMPLIIRGENIKISRTKANKFLKLVKLEMRSNHFPSELSGGEQQRVAIARSLVAETDLILADEPTGNLDYRTSNDIFSYFIKLKKMKKTIIFATHNRELANKADYKLSISQGIIKRVNAKT